MPELISVLRKHLVNHQVFAKEEDIFITTGSQQALFILASMDFPCPDGRGAILAEQPTYHVMLEAAKANNIPVIGIRRTENGLDPAELERILACNKIKFFYLMPRFQNPTGYSYTNAQKKQILRLAGKYRAYIVEDDYLADLEINRKNDPFAALDTEGRVIYVRSFSKTLLPGLRLGMAVIPEELQDGFIRMKNAIDLNSSVYSQGALEIYLRSSMYEAHVKRTKAFYKNKMDILSEECERELSDTVNCHVPPTGIFACIEAGASKFPKDVIGKLEKDGLRAMSTDPSYLDGFPHPEGIRLCICRADAEAIPRAVQIIKKTLAE
jgi:DNA-binding transcriptional MocR family regulator